MEEKPLTEFEQRARAGPQRGLFGEMLAFLWQTKKWWMVPVVITLMLVGLLVFLSSSAAAPFIYTLF